MDILTQLKNRQEVLWQNPDLVPFAQADFGCTLGAKDIADAEARLLRFAPLIRKCFPETESASGIIESALTEIPEMQKKAGISGPRQGVSKSGQ